MKKRTKRALSAFLIVFCMVGALAGCNGGGGQAAAGVDMTMTLEKDLGISVNGTWFPILKDVQPLIAALGSDYELETWPSCVFEGEDKVCIYSQCEVYTNPSAQQDTWYDIVLTDDTLSTARGIKVGDTLAAVQQAYGEKFYWEGNEILTYSISGVQGDIASPCILFTIVSDKVERIEIYYPTNTN